MSVFEALPFMLASRCLGLGKALFLQTLRRQARQVGQVAGVAFDDLWRYIHVRDLAARRWFIKETAAQEITPQEVEVVPSGPLDWLPAHLTEIREADVQGIRPQEVEVRGGSLSESVSFFSGENGHQAEDSEVDMGVGG